jgi:Icc protein
MSTAVAGSEVLRLWQFSDTHLFADQTTKLYDIDCLASLRQVLALAMAAGGDADLALFTGDLTHDGSVPAYQHLLTEIETLGIPACCLPGNHDEPAVMRAVLATDTVSCDGHIMVDDWLIVMLDTTVAGSDAGRISEGEATRLVSLLAQHPRRHVVVALHHPPLPTTMTWMDRGVTLDNPERLHAIVADHPRIRGVIWGHAHQAFAERRNGCLWAGCPSTMVQFKPGVDDFTLDALQPGFRYLDLYADGKIETGVIRL